jgi:hypothetical protein
LDGGLTPRERTALQLPHLDMKRKDALRESLQLQPRRRRGDPLLSFLHAILDPRAQLLGPVARWQTLQVTKDNFGSFADDSELCLKHQIFLSLIESNG